MRLVQENADCSFSCVELSGVLLSVYSKRSRPNIGTTVVDLKAAGTCRDLNLPIPEWAPRSGAQQDAVSLHAKSNDMAKDRLENDVGAAGLPIVHVLPIDPKLWIIAVGVGHDKWRVGEV